MQKRYDVWSNTYDCIRDLPGARDVSKMGRGGDEQEDFAGLWQRHRPYINVHVCWAVAQAKHGRGSNSKHLETQQMASGTQASCRSKGSARGKTGAGHCGRQVSVHKLRVADKLSVLHREGGYRQSSAASTRPRQYEV